MKGQFTNSSDLALLLLFPTLIIATIFAETATKWYVPNAVTVVFGILSLLCLLTILISCYIPCSFDAKENEVRFIKTDVIKYSDIWNIEIKREHHDTRYGTKCEETICFELNDRKLMFKAPLDINYDKVEIDPTYLTKQFETSQFSQLKRFIESKMDIIQGGRSNV
ncbi:hypothetical protein [Ruminococcus albus]|uniref:Uncharacterized protein n=1 Tax=Ruminococcus albus TaxID=1264 RepID=A0A1H7GHB6_RUMAL|nr:hypothetical protein [Ruminococcus albus]SEK37636.1 hypothetical protein SAMN05216469_102113 [Ruminococcus albus]